MASSINTIYKRFNGTDWDTIYFKTTASQVIESTAKRFLVPTTHTINGKYFFTTTDSNGVAQGIVLYGTDIKVDNSIDAPTIASQIANINNSISSFQNKYLSISAAASTYATQAALKEVNDMVSAIELGDTKVPYSSESDNAGYALRASKDEKQNVIHETYATIVALQELDDTVSEILFGDTVVPKATEANSAGYALEAGSAIKDSNGNIIADTYIPLSQRGTANGIATLNDEGKVPTSQLPSYVDDVIEYAGQGNFPTTGETGKIYVDTTNNKTYRWSGTGYVEISSSLALGYTSATAYRGDLGKANADAITALQEAVSAIELGDTIVPKATEASTAGYATKATQDGNGKNIADTYATIVALQELDDTVSEILFGDTVVPKATEANSAGYALEAGSATSATNDSEGNNISTTYLKKGGDTVTGQIDFNKRPTFKASPSSTIYHTHKIIFYGSATPDGAQSGDIWLATA